MENYNSVLHKADELYQEGKDLWEKLEQLEQLAGPDVEGYCKARDEDMKP